MDIFPLNLGTNTFGWTADRETSFTILDEFVAAGGNFLDTADMYSSWVPGNVGGESETIIGEWRASRRPRDLIIATKSGAMAGTEGRSRAATFQAVEDSLRRLGVDTIDLFYHHHDDESVDIEDQVAIAVELIESGKIKSLGLSNYSPERLRAFFAVSRGTPAQPVAIQPEYSLVHRADVEKHVGPIAAEYGASIFPYYSLASGLLTGKYRTAADLEGAARGGGIQLTGDTLGVVDVLIDVADHHNSAPTTVALAWLLAKGVAAPIASVSRPDQLPALMAAPRLELSDEDVTRLDRVSEPFA